MRLRACVVCAVLLLAGACAGLEPKNENAAPLPIKQPGAVPIGEVMGVFYTYPTGRFDARWLSAARVDDALLKAARPLGEHPRSKSTHALPSGAFTSIGPKPLLAFGDQYSGRVNDIVVSPQPRVPGDPNSYRAFIASDGGGVWRSDNCCSANTIWSVVTDDPLIAASAIGDLEMDPNNPDVVYAGTGDLRFGTWSFGSAGVLKTSNGGDNWEVLGADVFVPNYPAALSAFSQYQSVGKVVVDPNNSSRLVVGTKTGLYFSYDSGRNWTGPCLTNPYGPTSGNPHRQDMTGLLALDFAGNTTLIAAVGTRGSATPVQPDLDNNGANGIYRAQMPTAGCPAQWTHISRADNGWVNYFTPGQPLNVVGRIEIAAARGAPNVLYAEAISASTFNVIGVWRSVDAGSTWEPRTHPNSFPGCPTGNQNWYNAGITVDPNSVDTLYLSAWDVHRSTDGAANFANITCTGTDQRSVHIDQHARAFVGNDSNRLLIGNDGGVYYSANARATQPSFTTLNNTINTIEFYSGDISANFADASQRVTIGGAQDNGTSVLQQTGIATAASWTHIYGGDGITTRIEPVFGQRVYMSSQRGNLVMSTNGPNAPEANASGPWGAGETTGDRKSFLMPYDLYKYGDLLDPDSGCSTSAGCNQLIAGTYRVWESANGAVASTAAARWSAISPDLTKNNLLVGTDNRSVIQSLAYAVSDRRVAMAGTIDGNLWYGFTLGTSGAASSWVNVTGDNAVLPNRSILKVATDPINPLIGYAAVAGFGANTPATPGHVYQIRCSANCATFTWLDKSGNLPDIPVNSVIVNPHLPRQVYAGSDWGLYFTDNIEAQSPVWQRFTGLPRVMVWDMSIDRGFTTLAVFTRSRGAFVWPLPRAASQPNLTGLWAAEGQDGWGLSIAHQGEVLFPAWYTYDATGRPIWYLVSGAARQADGSYLGEVFRFTGTPFSQINGVANQPGVSVGTARLTALESGSLQFAYTVEGISQVKTVRRLAPGPIPSCRFTTGSRASAANHTDTWWNPAESGWGIQFVESGNLIFLAWYTYANDGNPMWVTGLLTRQADGRYTGSLNRAASGVPFSMINGPATTFPVPTVGNAALIFSNGERGTFTYTLDGVTQQKPIERFVYAGPTQTVCE